MSNAEKVEMTDEQKKPKRKRKKSMRGQPEIYDECKQCASYSLTPKGQKGVEIISEYLGISRSEVLEQVGRGKLRITELKPFYEGNSDFFDS